MKKRIRICVSFFLFHLTLTMMSLVSRESCFRKQCTVVPTQSDSDVTFCLQLLSKILTCKDKPKALKRDSIYNIDMLF